MKPIKSLYVFLLFWVSFSLKAQQYPVEVQVFVTPPYSQSLRDYWASFEPKMQVHLLLKDLNSPMREVALRFSLENAQGQPLAQTPDFLQPFQTQLASSVRKTLSNIELKTLFAFENLHGISEHFYNNLLPEGAYFLCFRAYDVATQTPLSAKARTLVQIRRYTPPLLTLPAQGEVIAKQNQFQHLVFQWMLRDPAPFTQYEFTLKEVWDNSLSPEQAFISGRLVYQGKVPSNTILYGTDKPILLENRRYAWKVRAFTQNPNNPHQRQSFFDNNGESQAFYFDYVSHCQAPKFLIANAQGNTENIRWSGEPMRTDLHSNGNLYKILYREKGKNWKSQTSYHPQTTLVGLKRGRNYIYKVGIACGLGGQSQSVFDEQTYLYSAEQEFVTPHKSTDSTGVQCGVKPQIRLKNREPLQEVLGENETFMAGDFPVTIIRATGSNGVFSGEGYVQVPYLLDTKIKVKFDGIKINTERQLFEGKLVTTYDEQERNLQFVQEGIGEVFGDAGVKTNKIDFEIAKIQKDANGRIVIVGKLDPKTGIAPQVVLPAGSDYQLFDASDKVWTLDEQGEVTSVGEKSDTQLAQNRNKNNLPKGQVKSENFEIKWDFSPSEFAFDTSNEIPYKALVKGKNDVFQVVVQQKDTLRYSFHFQTDKGLKVESKKEKEGIFKISRKGLFDFADEELWVVAKEKNTDKEQLIGKCILVHLSPKMAKVKLIPTLKNIKNIDIEQIKQIYSKVGVDLQIETENTFDISNYLINSTLETKNVFWDLTDYSPTQQNIITQFKNTQSVDNEAYYVFLTDAKSSTGQGGYMPLGGQFGFAFLSEGEETKDLARTIAHELGHGIFKLEHPFKKDQSKKGTYRTLMDYAQETTFAYADWKQINDPALKIGFFQGQQEGEYRVKVLDYVCVSQEIPIPHILKDLDNQSIILGKEYRVYAFVGSKTKEYKGRVAIIQHIPSKKLYFPLQSQYGEERHGYMAFDTDNNQTILFKDFTLSNKKGNLVYATDFCEYYVNDKKVKRIEKCRDCNGLPQRDEQNHKFFIDEKILTLPNHFSVEASNENEIKENMRIIINADRRGQRADKQDLSYSYSLLPSNEKAQDIYKTIVTLWNNYENSLYKNHLNPLSYRTADYFDFENEKKRLDNKKLLMPELIRDNTLRNVSENFIKEFFKNKIKGYMNLTNGLVSTYLWNENQRAKYEKAGEDLVNHFYKKTGENYYATKTISEAIYKTEDGKRRIDNMIKLINHIFMYEISNNEVIQKNPLDDDWFTNRININCFPGFEAEYLYNRIFSDESENKERLGNNERLALFCIGGTQGAKVGIKEWRKIAQNDKIGYEATVILEYFDTFGVSENDYTKDLGFLGNNINLAAYNYRGGVLAQWILQHQYGYQPFKDHLTYVIEIKHLWKK